jgi:hypothetical protein
VKPRGFNNLHAALFTESRTRGRRKQKRSRKSGVGDRNCVGLELLVEVAGRAGNVNASGNSAFPIFYPFDNAGRLGAFRTFNPFGSVHHFGPVGGLSYFCHKSIPLLTGSVPHFRQNIFKRFRIVWGETEGAAEGYFTPAPDQFAPRASDTSINWDGGACGAPPDGGGGMGAGFWSSGYCTFFIC